MSGFWGTAALIVAGAMALSLYRVVKGPTHFDRLTGLGLIGTKTTVLLILLGTLSGRADMFVDIALAYSLVAFIGTLALAKYFEKGGRHEP